jgi:hypothetical protein
MSGRTELVSFRNFITEYRQLVLLGIGGSAVPIAAALFSLTPAWPAGIAGVTAVAQLLVLALIFQLLRSARRRVVNRVMIRSTILLCMLLPIYLLFIALFTYTEPVSKLRFTKGFECTDDAKLVFHNKCPFLGTDEISTAQYEEETLWTAPSVSAMKSLIVIVWLGCFATLSTILGCFVVFQMNQKQKIIC